MQRAIQDGTTRARRRDPAVGQPWLGRKLMVPIVFGLFGYTAYVYIGKFCIPVVLDPQKGVVMTRAAARM
jgi:hypothetical protein